MNESVDVPMQEVAEGDEITSAQPLTQEPPPVAIPPCSNNLTSPAPNMGATDREHIAATAPRKKGRSKLPRANVIPTPPFSMGLTYPYTDHFGYWAGQGQHFQMSYQPQVPLLSPSPGLSSWYTPPSVNLGMQGGASQNPRSSRRWVPFFNKKYFLMGKYVLVNPHRAI